MSRFSKRRWASDRRTAKAFEAGKRSAEVACPFSLIGDTEPAKIIKLGMSMYAQPLEATLPEFSERCVHRLAAGLAERIINERLFTETREERKTLHGVGTMVKWTINVLKP